MSLTNLELPFCLFTITNGIRGSIVVPFIVHSPQEVTYSLANAITYLLEHPDFRERLISNSGRLRAEFGKATDPLLEVHLTAISSANRHQNKKPDEQKRVSEQIIDILEFCILFAAFNAKMLRILFYFPLFQTLARERCGNKEL